MNLASIVSTTGLPPRACYGASKGAVLRADDGDGGRLRRRSDPRELRVPGHRRHAVGRAPARQGARPRRRAAGLVARQPIGRLGTAEEIAAAIVYLASPEAGYVTGTALPIDGGTQRFQLPRDHDYASPALRALDVRAPTSRTLAGSDAVHHDPDYSAAYVFLETDGGARGRGMTLHHRARQRPRVRRHRGAAPHVVGGRDLEELVADVAAFWRRAHQRRPAALARAGEGRDPPRHRRARERGVGPVGEGRGQAAVAAGRRPDARAVRRRCVDFRYLTDVLDRDEALDMLRARSRRRRRRAIAELRRDGYPAYLTSAGWLGYPEEKVRDLCREALADGWRCFKTKVGVDVASDVRRCEVMREEIGDLPLMADANQVWDVREAIEWMRHLAPFGCAGSRSRRAPTTCSATRRSAARSRRSVSRPASTRRTG